MTVAMKSVEFHKPVFVGDSVSFWTQVMHVGETSIVIHITVETDRDDEVKKLSQAEVTYVAVKLVDGLSHPVRIRGK